MTLLASPKVAIVIPIFKHSVLVGEAISCALQQETEFETVIILVNDGCSFVETDRICKDFALAHPERVVYLYRPNGGLSAARNTGINFALTSWSSIEAIYFLDADNRLEPYSISQAYNCLQKYPDVGWLYPTIDMFGREKNFDFRGEYSILRHLRLNFCEAGSMIRREVFAAGCRYDESMKLGYEDWEFWWQAIEAGFKGKHLPEFGFQYRKRFESMLADSERDSKGIVDYMRRKHRKLFDHRKIVELEHQEAPRYAVVLSDTKQVYLTSDPEVLENEINLDKFRELYQRGQALPVRYHRPQFLVFADSSVVSILHHHRVLRWAFWKLECLQNDSQFSILHIDTSSDIHTLAFEIQTESNFSVREADQLIMTSVQILDSCLKDSTDEWIHSLTTSNPLPKISVLNLKLPGEGIAEAEVLDNGALYKLLSFFKRLRRANAHSGSQNTWDWYEPYLPDRSRMFEDVRVTLDCGPAYPILTKTNQKHVGFILSIIEFGGVEKVALNIAKVFKENGWHAHLFIFGSQMQELPEWAKAFETINFYYESSFKPWQGEQYFGSKSDAWSDNGNHRVAKGLMSWLDVAITFHSTTANGVIPLLRRAGVKTATSLHVHDLSAWGRPVGYTYLTLGYEHAYDFILPCSYQLTRWCHSIGIPEDKLITIPNAAGYPLEQDVQQAIVARRRQREFGGQLKVLFIGRLDRQKGLDRLAGVIAESQRQNLPIKWRLVGKKVVGGEDVTQELKIIQDLVEPPALTIEQLNKLYEWADILLLPSYWEGLPLTILEAMRLGVVVFSSDVGAVSEVIRSGENGILIESDLGSLFQKTVIKELKDILDNPEKLNMLSENAISNSASRSWKLACSSFIKRLEVEELR